MRVTEHISLREAVTMFLALPYRYQIVVAQAYLATTPQKIDYDTRPEEIARLLFNTAHNNNEIESLYAAIEKQFSAFLCANDKRN